jgi:hypothetical protein
MPRLSLWLPIVAVAISCKGPMARIEALRDALVADDSSALRDATSIAPPCSASSPPESHECLTSVANAIGSKRGFVANPPDHAGASAAALVLLRNGRGDWLEAPDDWLADVKNAKGIGHDVLRLAIARKMAEAAPAVGRKIDDEAAARAALLAVVGAVPGACPTYWLLGSGSGAAIPPELSADHSACVQKDLARREGPGGSYGSGVFRAVEGALALWRETERGLRLGLAQTDPGAKVVLEKKLATIEQATKTIATKKLAPDEGSPSGPLMAAMREAHAEAGVPLFDAGANKAGGRSP